MSSLKKFSIMGMHGERNVTIPFDDGFKIIVAENGFGKTTILNSLHSILYGDVSKLRKLDFREIHVEFDDEFFCFSKEDLAFDLSEMKNEIFFNPLLDSLDDEVVVALLEDYKRFGINKSTRFFMERSTILRKVRREVDFPLSMLVEQIEELYKGYSSEKSLGHEVSEKLSRISDKFVYSSLYLPTYRRVEEESVVGVDDSMPINYGMGDVRNRIDNLTKEILTSSVEWFSKINGQMLSQLVNGFEVTEEMRSSLVKPHAVEVVLSRIGDNISEGHKEEILELVKTGDIFKGHDPLVYFVANLLKVYEQQKDNDQRIQGFTVVCNKYLRDKKVVYDESNVSVSIVRKKNGSPVRLDSLSSGEKQIISLFALLYLQKEESFAVFFDEPELSLSMEWQKTLLPDIIDSQKCGFMFVATHSPFIFQNELESCTFDLEEYIEEL